MMISNLFKKNTNTGSKDESFRQVCEMIRDIDPEKYSDVDIQQEMELDDLGFDSIVFMQLVLSFSDYFDTDIEEVLTKVDLKELKTVGDIVDVVDRLKS